MMHDKINNIIAPTPLSPTNVPDLRQEFEHPFYTTKRPTNIMVNFHQQQTLTNKRELSALTPIQELDLKNTKEKVMRRDQSLEFEEAKRYIRSMSF